MSTALGMSVKLEEKQKITCKSECKFSIGEFEVRCRS